MGQAGASSVADLVALNHPPLHPPYPNPMARPQRLPVAPCRRRPGLQLHRQGAAQAHTQPVERVLLMTGLQANERERTRATR